MSGYYQAQTHAQGQGQPIQQQQPQYPPVFQQPQNIYQQLGKPQPQPHLQTHPTYSLPQQQQQSQGFQFNQPQQYVQGPSQAMQAPYALSQTPYSAQQAPYNLSQTPYIPSQTPFTSQTPYPISQTPYAPVQYVQQQYPPQQSPPIQHPPTQAQISQISTSPTSSYPNGPPNGIPLNSSGSVWRTPSSRPPPVALSASLAQQAQAQAKAQAQVQVQTRVQVQPQSPPQTIPTPQTPGRRPLPQPSPGANAKTPILPPGNVSQRIPNLSGTSTSTPGSGRPFPVQPIQTTLPQASKTQSPTRSRPLPNPAESPNKGNTVDLAKLPQTSFGSGPPQISNTNSGSSTTSSSLSWLTKREASPTKSSLPLVSEIKASKDVGLSRTSSYAVGLNSTSVVSGAPKRRTSPPRFQPQPNSASSSPTKERSIETLWNTDNNNTNTSSNPSTNPNSSSSNMPPRILTANAPLSSSPTKSNSSSISDVSSVSSPSSATAPPRKFIPMWKRTIPEMPAPAWGYAAGMVSEPHPKPPPPPQPVAAPPASVSANSSEKEKEKGRGKLKKKSGPPASASAPAPAPAPVPIVAPANPTGQYSSQYQQKSSQGLNSGYPRASAVQQKYPAQQQQQQQQFAQYIQPRGLPSHQQQQAQQQQLQDEEEETEEDETEEDEEEEEEEKEEEEEAEETEETEESELEHRYAKHSRQHSQPQSVKSGNRHRSQSRGRYAYEEEEEEEEEEPTPRKNVLRPKAKGSPYTADSGASPLSNSKIKPKILTRREGEESYPIKSQSKIKLRPKSRSNFNDDEEQERTPKKNKVARYPVESPRGHERSKSAFEEREVVRHRREPSERERPRSGSAFAGDGMARRRTRPRYEEEDEEEDEEEEEEESDMEWKRVPKKKNPLRDARGDRRQTQSPQYGIRDMRPVNRRSGSESGSALNTRHGGGYEEPDEEVEEEEEDQNYHRKRRPATADRQREREPGYQNGREREREWERDSDIRYRAAGGRMGTGSGLPQPPAMEREAGKLRGGPRLKSTPIKFDDYDGDDSREHDRHGGQNLSSRFSAMNMNGNDSRNRTDNGGSTNPNSWPVGLPRLPRTPGTTTPGSVVNNGGGYFDLKPQSIPNTPSGFQSGQIQVQREMNDNRILKHRTNLNLDDPPPRSTVVRTPSPGPSGYTLRRELPQPHGRPQSQANPQPAQRVTEQLARRRSLYSVPSSTVDQVEDLSKGRRPQSQIYNVSNSNPHQMGHHSKSNSSQFSSNQLSHAFNNARYQPQTPAPPPTLGIESPHPVGGRNKMADIPKMEEDSNDGSDTEHRQLSRMRGDYPSRVIPPTISVDASQSNSPSIPMISINSSPSGGNRNLPSINISSDEPSSSQSQRHDVNEGPRIQVYEIPGVSVSAPGFDDHHGGPTINISGTEDHHNHNHRQHSHQNQHPQQGIPTRARSQTGELGRQSRGGLICGGCDGPIIGRIVSAMGSRYHPGCFKCTVCGELLEHVSSYEHEGRPYCHLDYHENFAPKCYSCKTAIIEEQFISLDDPALGKRAYHTQHFFCSECGDPFLTPSGGLPSNSGELALSGDGEFEGFTVYKGYPYCEACHVRLRLPKCKRCKKSIRDNEEAVEALGGKWCWGCFVCASCSKPFENPSFFQRDDQPYCEHCFSIMLRNEI